MQENARYLAALRKLLDRPENRVCADCKVQAAARIKGTLAATWLL